MNQLSAYAFSLAIELAVLLALRRRFELPVFKVVLWGSMATGISHPIAWHYASTCSGLDVGCAWWEIESAVCLFEAGVFRGLLTPSWVHALALSALANLASALPAWCG